MTDRLVLSRRYRYQLEALLSEHAPGVEVWAYGSRVTGEGHEASDLDLVLRSLTLEPLDGGFYDLLEAIEKSNIPILVQVHDWARLPESFHREIERDYVVVQAGANQTTAGEWREYEFGALSDITRGASPRPIHEWISEKGIPWLKIADASATASRFIKHTKERIRPDGVSKSVPVFPGDLILSNSATPGIPKFVGVEACIHDGWLLLRNLRYLDKLFCYYLLLFERPRIVEQGSGTVFTNLKTDILKRHRVKIPLITEQRAIAHVLGTLDDKIELNRRMNETLEEMARTLFKSWFVDFEPVRAKMEGRWRRGEPLPGLPAEHYDLFPDRLVDSELGEIPEGWEIKTLGELAQLNPESWSKKNCPPEVKYVDLANTKWGVVESTQRFLWKDVPSRARRILRPGDTIVGTVRPGNGSYSLIESNGLTGSTGFAVLRPLHPRFRELVYLSATALDNIERLAHRADGAAYPAVRPEIVSETEVAIPTDETDILDWFSIAAGSILNKIESNESESRSLAEQRDALLPKLVSGEVRVDAIR